MSFKNIIVEADGYVAVVLVNRPDKLNALNRETISELTAFFEKVGTDNSIGAVVFTGAGDKAFIAGADIGMLAEQGVLDGRENGKYGQRLTCIIENCPKPVLAAVNGYALGGGLEMAMACDVRYASDNARLGLPEVSLGVIPGYGGTQRLPRIVGEGNALGMILSGDPVTAEEALRMGLVNGIFPQEELRAKVVGIAKRMLSRGPTALSLAKQAVRRGADLPLEEGLNVESDLFGLISSTDEMREGMQAFLGKREPSWKRK